MGFWRWSFGWSFGGHWQVDGGFEVVICRLMRVSEEALGGAPRSKASKVKPSPPPPAPPAPSAAQPSPAHGFWIQQAFYRNRVRSASPAQPSPAHPSPPEPPQPRPAQASLCRPKIGVAPSANFWVWASAANRQNTRNYREILNFSSSSAFQGACPLVVYQGVWHPPACCGTGRDLLGIKTKGPGTVSLPGRPRNK